VPYLSSVYSELSETECMSNINFNHTSTAEEDGAKIVGYV